MTIAPPPVGRTFSLFRLRLRLGVIATLLILLIGFVSIVWMPYPVDQLDPMAQTQAPSVAHLLGTDALGRDTLSMTMKGILTSFVVAGVAAAIGLFIGIPLAVAAARWGLLAERVLVGGAGIFVSLSALGIAVLLTLQFGPSALNAMIAIGLYSIAVVARQTRDDLRTFQGLDYLAASRLAGLAGWELARRHVLPGLVPLLGGTAMAQLAQGVLLEAGLGYLGLASQPPGSSLGLMLRDAQSVMLIEPKLTLVPGGALLLIVLALNFLARGLRREAINAA
jgi:peptide/nickel transport system permease protein